MRRRPSFPGSSVALAAALLASVFLAACGGDDNGDGSGTTSTSAGQAAKTGAKTAASSAVQAQGEQVFMSAGCASCHTLKAAGASGNVGPNLDQTKPDKATVAQKVTQGGGGMPSFRGQLSAKEINAVATYVSSVAGQ